MASKKLTALSAFGATLNNSDLIHLVDVSDTTQDPAGSSYKLSLATLKAFIDTDTDTNIYNSDGSLTANRTVTMAGFSLSFLNGNIGIGTSPASDTKQHIVGTNALSTGYCLKLEGSSNRAALYVRNDGIWEGGRIVSSTAQNVTNFVYGTTGLTLNTFTTGTGNVVWGATQNISLTTANTCVLIGNAGRQITTGGSNFGLGNGALDSLVSGTLNVAIGVNALSVLTGSNVVGIGNGSGINFVSGSGSTFVGDNAGSKFSSGTAITAIGYYAGERVGTSSAFGGNTYLGRESESNDAGECVIGGITPTKFYLGRGKFSPDADDTSTSYILSIPSVDATGNGMSRTALTNATSLFDFVLRPSGGTGTGNSGKVIIQRGVPGASGSTLNTFADVLTFQGKNITSNQGITNIHFGSTNNSYKDQPVLYGATTDSATAVELTTDGAAGSGSTNRISVPNNTALAVTLSICVKQSGSSNSKQMLRQFVIVNNGGTTTIEGAVTTLGTDIGSAGLTTVTTTITANDTDDCIKIEVNGVAATNLRYTAQLLSVETLYA